METGKITQFKYRGRGVKGIVKRIDEKTVVLELLTDYIGKNEEWYKGEDKVFYRSLIKTKTQQP